MKTDAAADHSFAGQEAATTDLPFVEALPGGLKDLWAVVPTGDWSQDCDEGARHGVALITHMQATANPSILGLIVNEITQRGAWTGVECGFFHTIGQAAAR